MVMLLQKQKQLLQKKKTKVEANKKIEKEANIIDDIKELNQLYKDGVLTKEQFEKAKNKLLN